MNRSLLLLPFGLFGLALVNCSKPAREAPEDAGREERAPERAPEEESGAPKQWTQFKKRDRDIDKEIAGKVMDSTYGKNYEKLEELADTVFPEASRRRNGGWGFAVFYETYANYADWNQRDSERYFPVLEKRILEWQAQFPDSPRPPIALAALYSGWAWKARTSGWASEVTEEGWKEFGKKLEQGEAVLKEHEALVKDDPYYYHVMLRLGLGFGWPMDKINAIFDAGQQLRPDVAGLYYRVAYHQVPRWHGKDHTQWHEWLVGALAKAPGITDERRDELYASVVLDLRSYVYDERDEPNVFKVAGADWERVKRGAERLMEQFPEATRLPSRYLDAAMDAGDFDTARSIVKRMNYRYDGREWFGTDDEKFFAILEFLEKSAVPEKTNSEESSEEDA